MNGERGKEPTRDSPERPRHPSKPWGRPSPLDEIPVRVWFVQVENEIILQHMK